MRSKSPAVAERVHVSSVAWLGRRSVFFATLLLGFFSAVPGLRAAETAPVAAAPLVVTHATLWTDAASLNDHEIVIRDGRVVAVGRSGSLPRPASARLIDAQGDTLLPGLIDAHLHLVLGARTPREFSATEIYAATAKQLLRSGVTSGRIHLMNIADGPALKKNAAEDRHPSPRLQLGGPGFFGGQPTWESPRGNAWGVKSIDDAVEKVRRVQAAGADWIALHEVQKFLPGEAEAIVAEAKRLGLGLMVGGDRFAEVERGVALGVDSVEYLDFSLAERYPDALLAQMKARGTTLFFAPPIGYNHRFMAYRQGTMPLDGAHLTEFFPPAIGAAAIAALRDDHTKPTAQATRVETAFATLPGKFRQLRAAGLQVVVASDCGSDANFQADSIWWEFETWRSLGVPPHEIVRAATTLPAQLLRASDIGRLAVGARGDFVLYRGRIEAGALGVARVRAVAKGGVIFVEEGRWVAASPASTPTAP